MKSDNLKLLIQAGNPIISMETADEPRATRVVREAASQLRQPLSQWSVTEGLVPVPPEATKTLVEPGKAAAALQYVKQSEYPVIYCFKDLGAHCKDPQIEKAFASATSDSADGGLSQRMFGTLLSWMQDHRHPIFLIATANNIAQLPPELMRKGRFDEIFFLDLPAAKEREAIFSIHLKKRRRDPGHFDMARLVAASDGSTGSEIEQAVISGLYGAFAEKAECSTEHIVAAIQATQPLAVVMRERVEQLRSWAAGRCVPAD